jgi:hypothetical protein
MGAQGNQSSVISLPPQIPEEIGDSLGLLRSTFVAIIEAVCGGSPRAQDVTDSFAVHRKLGWQIWNVAYADDPLAGVRYLPNARGIELWRTSATLRGVPSELLTQLDSVVEQFNRVISTHAEDRDMLEMMLESGSNRLDEAAEVRWRKHAFTGNSFIWGVRAKTLLATVLLHPSQRDGFFDMVRIHGLIDLIRTRSSVRWPFSQSIVQTDDGVERTPRRQPLVDSDAVRQLGVPLLEEFCSRPLPPVQRRTSEIGMLEDELLPGPAGQTGASTVITAEIVREVAPVYPTCAGEVALFGAGVRTPGEVLVSDHFVHRELFKGVTRELCVFGELISNTTRDERDRIPAAEKLQHLGRGIQRVRTAEVPRYAELLERVFEQTGWKAEDFDVYRVRMRYPPIPVSVMVRHEMPPRGQKNDQ